MSLTGCSLNTLSVASLLPKDLLERLVSLRESFTGFTKNKAILEDLVARFETQYKEALAESSISMLPCYNHMVSGKEVGTYLLLDVGGSTLRVSVVHYNGPALSDRARISSLESHVICEQRKLLDEAFFDWIAQKIDAVLGTNPQKTAGECIPAAITWSFPLVQTSVDDGIINECGKGYIIDPSIQNRSLKQLIEESCEKRNLNICVKSLVNDGVAVLLGSSYFAQSTSIGLVLGTGTNCSVYLPLSSITGSSKLKENEWMLDGSRVRLVNTELSFFGEFLEPYITEYDLLIYDWSKISNAHIENDSSSLFQPLEFVTSGRYVGELVRLVVLDLIQEGIMFLGQKLNPRILEKYDYFSGAVCINLKNRGLGYALEIFGCEVSEASYNAITEIIDIVVQRAASILVCSLLGFENFQEQKELNTIGFEGSFLHYSEDYKKKIIDLLKEMRPNKRYELRYAEKSSIYGSALAAASCS